MGQERRRHRRERVRIPAGIYFKDSHQYLDAEIIDLSEGGAYIQCNTPLEIGKEIVLEIRFGESQIVTGTVIQDMKKLETLLDPSDRQASIVRWNKVGNTAGFGVEFIGLSAQRKTFIRTVVQHLTSVRRQNEGRKPR